MLMMLMMSDGLRPADGSHARDDATATA